MKCCHAYEKRNIMIEASPYIAPQQHLLPNP